MQCSDPIYGGKYQVAGYKQSSLRHSGPDARLHFFHGFPERKNLSKEDVTKKLVVLDEIFLKKFTIYNKRIT